MVPEATETTPNKTRRAIVKLLKTEGAMDAARMGERLALTPMAVRQHLYELQREKLVEAEEKPVPLGRPAKYWKLTSEADRLFPDAYAELSVALIDALGETFGDAGLKRVLQSRLAHQQQSYAGRIPSHLSLKEKLQRLAHVRTEEGYMAELRKEKDGSFLLIENHCPICAAATACKGFCATELDLFRSVLGKNVSVEREEHILAGARRCAYRIKDRGTEGPVPRSRPKISHDRLPKPVPQGTAESSSARPAGVRSTPPR